MAKELSLAKMQALAGVQQKRRDAAKEQRRSLCAPAGFRTAQEFLSTVADLCGRRIGGMQELAIEIGIDKSTVSKWLRTATRGTANRFPTQANLDKIIVWWRAHRANAETPAFVPQVEPAGRSNMKAVISISRLPPEISERLRLTAKARNLEAIVYLTQLLDRQLASLVDLKG